MTKTMTLAVLCCFLCNAQMAAHGDLSEQIKHVSKKIEKDPDNAKLYLKRGQLHAQHKEFVKAKSDYVQARQLDQQLLVTDHLLAQLFAAYLLTDSALVYVNAFLEHNPNHSKALITRAGVYQQLGDFESCQKDFSHALSNLKTPHPKHYLAISRAVLMGDSSNVSEAIEWLKKGEAAFGFDIVLKSEELDLYIKSGQLKNAIRTVDTIIKQFNRKEKWLFKKATVYEKAGKMELAKKEYEATLMAIQQLPKRLQKTAKMLELEAQTYMKLEDLSK